jgi:P-type Cu+ transporter
MTTDPVCGATVDDRKPPATSNYQGQRYVFCGVQCKEEFDAEPERYAEEQPRKATG